ncbi:hypothetical protein H4R99_000062 [Coemansia sp. RSA 1722]|nr:hypothetical protein LPJ57_003707 [Coemansia sp. RSA 486]KAJ2238436.1 hypothetical protein IWW45_000056 [Coemansia sp. RSA 485]KAJ2606889.1 hypothetical protein H4R99_000062 [Coemansia sp. RSA 1722]
MDSSTQPAAATTQQQAPSANPKDFKEFSIKVKDGLDEQTETTVRNNIENSITQAGGTFDWVNLTKMYMVKIPVVPSADMVSISSASALEQHLKQSVTDGIEFVDEEGMLKTQNQ